MDTTALFILILCSSTWGSILPGGSHHHDHQHNEQNDHHPDQHGDHHQEHPDQQTDQHHGHHAIPDHHNHQDHSDHQTSTASSQEEVDINTESTNQIASEAKSNDSQSRNFFIIEPANQLLSKTKHIVSSNNSQAGISLNIDQGIIQPTDSALATHTPIISSTQPRPNQIIQQHLVNRQTIVQNPSVPSSSPKLLQSRQQDIPHSNLDQTQQDLALRVAGQLRSGLSQLIQQSSDIPTAEQPDITQRVPAQQPNIPNEGLTPPAALFPSHTGHHSANQPDSFQNSKHQFHGHRTNLENTTSNPKPIQQTVRHSTGRPSTPTQVSEQVNVPQNPVSQSFRSSISGNALEYNPNIDYSGLFLEEKKKFDGSDNSISKSLNTFGFNQNSIGHSDKGTSRIFGNNNLVNGVNYGNSGSRIPSTQQTFNVNRNNNINPTSSTVCKREEVKNIRGVCVKPEVSRNIYVFAPPTRPPRPAGKTWSSGPVPVPKVEYNIVFVRAPEAGQGAEPIIVGPPQQKTLVYVLSKKDQEKDPRIIEVTARPKTRPEVYYVNYNEGENPQLPGGIALNDALESSAQPGQNFDFHNDPSGSGAGAVNQRSTSGFINPPPIQPSQFVANFPTPQPTTNSFLPQRPIIQFSNPNQVPIGPTQAPAFFVTTGAPQQENNFPRVNNFAPQSHHNPHVFLHGVAVTQPSANIPVEFRNQATPRPFVVHTGAHRQPIFVQPGAPRQPVSVQTGEPRQPDIGQPDQGFNPFSQTFSQPQFVQSGEPRHSEHQFVGPRHSQHQFLQG